jgi:hypothetical protein
MSDDATPAKVRLTDGLGPDVTAWVCEYISGEVFVSMAREPMNDPDVCHAWRLLTMRERDAQVAAAVAAERERCAKLPRLPTPRLLASGTIAGKRVELHGWHTDDIEIWERQHGLKFGA